MRFLNIKTMLIIVFASLSISTLVNANHHMNKKNIIQTAAANPEFSTLVAAINAAELDDILNNEGPFTVFAPTNAAFNKLPDGTIESLLKPKNKDTLIAILTYHVLPGKVMAADVTKLSSTATVLGDDVSVKTMGSKVMINNAMVTETDIKTSNGVIHVIDTVLMPKD